MSLFGTELRYGTVAQAFHWVTAILVAAAWLTAVRDGSAVHETLGMAVFVVVALRLTWRMFDRRPANGELPLLVSLSSRLVHAILYALLLGIPASAVVGSWLEGHAVTILGIGDVGPLLTASRRVGHQILEVHQLLGDGIMIVAGLHAAAALFHHFFLKDRVLRQMLPAG